jgi:CubicO group peptidase (beta-lactamase class C family)
MTTSLQSVLEELLGKRGVRHAVLAVESGDRNVGWSGAGGDADGTGRWMTPDTPYFIASVTKLYIAAIVLRLAERNLVRLDDSFVTYVPAGIADHLHVLDGVDRTRDITVRHLLAHASGLADYLEDKPKTGPRFIDRLLSEGNRSVELTEVGRIVRDELTPPLPAPGSRRRWPRACSLLGHELQTAYRCDRDDIGQPVERGPPNGVAGTARSSSHVGSRRATTRDRT